MKVLEKIETKTATIFLDDEGILHRKIKEGAEVDLEEQKNCFNAYKKLGCQENKALLLVESGSFFSFDHDAQRYAAKEQKHFFIAAALVHNSLAIRVVYNFFNNFHTHAVPFKMFSTKKAALEWLRNFKMEKKS